MAITISGTNGIVGAGFTVDNSGVSVTAGVGTFSSIGAGTSIAAAGLHGTMPTINGHALTTINAANLVGLCTSGLTKTGGFGKMVQILSTNGGSSASTTSSSYQDTGLSQAITMTDASNKVLVTASGTVNNGSSDAGGKFTLYRGSTNLATNGDDIAGFWGEDNSNNITTTITMTFLDTPGTGTHTYAVYQKIWSQGTIRWGYLNNSSITCIEVVPS